MKEETLLASWISLNYCFLLSFLSLLVVFFLFYFFIYLFFFTSRCTWIVWIKYFCCCVVVKTKYQMIEYRQILMNIPHCFYIIPSESFQKSIYNSPSSHDNKNCHQLSSHCHISDAWRYLVHRCELVHYCQDLFWS